jgi:hypothetical protein
MNGIWQSLTCVAAGLVATGTGALLALRRRDIDAVARLCTDLEREDGGRAERFDPTMVADLPAPVRRYFLHAIQPGTPLARAVRLEMAGRMRLGADQGWMPFRARQILAPPAGFAWDATMGTGLKRFVGADTYSRRRGKAAFRLWDLIPVGRSGPDVSRAARGRLAIEAIWHPASLLPQRGVTWSSTDNWMARAIIAIDGEAIPLTLLIAPDGHVQSVTMERWGDLTEDGRFTLIPFGADCSGESTFGGYTVPSRLRVSWWYGTDHAFDFFHAEVAQATFLPCGDSI